MKQYKGRIIVAAFVLITASILTVVVSRTPPASSTSTPPKRTFTQPSRVHAPSKKLVRQSLSPSQPQTIRIPTLNINEPVQAVGINARGEMEEPKTRNAVGWYRFGYLPGALGNAVLAGHSIHRTGHGIFYSLDQLQPKDTIEIDTATHTLIFTVASKAKYHAETEERDVIFGKSDTARLNLITCNGTWDPSKKRYSDRLVVFSEFTYETSRVATRSR